jgi:hypothetical protein
MDTQEINKLLLQVSLDHSGMEPAEALKKIAVALMHMAKGIEEIRSNVASLRD